jgi:outer membrane murein-binding lipoprotein Lpp
MRNNVYSLAIIAIVIATILVAGCFAPTPTSQESSQVASTSSTAAATRSSAASTAAVTPSPSGSATPTQIAGRKSTFIQFDRDPGTVKQGDPVSLNIEVTASTSPNPMVCGDKAAVTVLVDGIMMGKVTPASGCFKTAYFDLSGADTRSLSTGTHTITLRYAGDSTHAPSQGTSEIIITSS